MKSILPLLLLGVVAYVLWQSQDSSPLDVGPRPRGLKGSPATATGTLFFYLKPGSAFGLDGAKIVVGGMFTDAGITDWNTLDAQEYGGAYRVTVAVPPAKELGYALSLILDSRIESLEVA